MTRLALALLMLAATGCNTLPVGEDGLGRIPSTDSLVVALDSSAGFIRYTPLGAADTMLLGRDDQYVSRALIKFALPDTSFDSLTQAQLILYPTDSTRMAFVAHPCSVDWRADAATWRIADSSTHWLNPGGDYLTREACRGTFVAGESLVIELDRSLMPVLLSESYGVILLPLDTGFVGLSSAFSSATAPRILLYWGAEKKSTRTITASEDAHIIDTIAIRAGLGYQPVGSGLAFRTWLRFNLDSIPPEATVARAEVRFTPAVEYHRSDTLPLGVRRLLEPPGSRGGNPNLATGLSGRLDYVVGPDSTPEAVLDIHKLVQYWTAHPDSNFGLYLAAEPDWAQLFRFRVPAAGPGAPRLDVLYAMPPTGRFW
ncbi:MAG: hypothetical protein R6X12_04680 [bacterium]